MHSAKLIWITPEAEKTIAHCARVSSPRQDNPEYEKLLRYCIKHKHWSIFEMASMCVEIKTTRAISPQILRHRSFSFQENQVGARTVVYIYNGAGDRERRAHVLFYFGLNARRSLTRLSAQTYLSREKSDLLSDAQKSQN